jgi:hypothetical protein
MRAMAGYGLPAFGQQQLRLSLHGSAHRGAGVEGFAEVSPLHAKRLTSTNPTPPSRPTIEVSIAAPDAITVITDSRPTPGK